MDVVVEGMAMVGEIISPVMVLFQVVVHGARVEPAFLGDVCGVEAGLVLRRRREESFHRLHRLLHQARRNPVVDHLRVGDVYFA